MKKKKFSLLLIVLIVSILLILTNFYTIKVLSAVRAYIHGESEYAKGQKDASLDLVNYVLTASPAYWHSFQQGIAIPIGDNIARTSMINKDTDEITKKGFLRGKNHPADIPDMIWLFKTFQSVSFMKKANSIWAAAEPLINQLDSTGKTLDILIRENRLTEAQKLQSIKAISILSFQLSKGQPSFSQVLGDAAREIKKYLQYANIFFILLMLGLVGVNAISMINSLGTFEKALKSKIAELNSTNKELEQFTRVASHDLQEPLRMVSGFLKLLQKKYQGKLDEHAQSYIQFAVDGATRMKTLISGLLDYSKTGGKDIAYEKVDLNKVVNEIETVFHDMLREDGAGIHFSSLPEIKAHPVQMHQLFQNLIGNAIKYRSESAPNISINATSNQTHWTFSIKDNGQGIASQYFGKIFIVFQRLHTNATHSGTGIGLATCKKIVERHGGKIWLESEVGNGSTFYFSISKQL